MLQAFFAEVLKRHRLGLREANWLKRRHFFSILNRLYLFPPISPYLAIDLPGAARQLPIANHQDKTHFLRARNNTTPPNLPFLDNYLGFCICELRQHGKQQNLCTASHISPLKRPPTQSYGRAASQVRSHKPDDPIHMSLCAGNNIDR